MEKGKNLFNVIDEREYIIQDLKNSTSNGKKKKKVKTREELDAADDDLIVTPLKRKRRAIPIGENDEVRNSDQRNSFDEGDSLNTVTFGNTKTYGKFLKASTDREDPQFEKYISGQGSVKGLHYRKYVALELYTEHAFALAFHKFFSQEVKNLIKNIHNTRFDPD